MKAIDDHALSLYDTNAGEVHGTEDRVVQPLHLPQALYDDIEEGVRFQA